MEDFTVRFAKKEEIPAINRFGTPIVKQLTFYSKEHIVRNLYELSARDLKDTFKEYKNSVVIAVTKEGKIIGFCTHYVGHGHVDWIDWLLVDKEYRKMGIGRALIEFVIKDARKRGCHKIWLDSHPDNKNARKFFPKMGFRKIGVAKRHAYKDDQIFWEKQIR